VAGWEAMGDVLAGIVIGTTVGVALRGQSGVFEGV